jgi:hypothetical protein
VSNKPRRKRRDCWHLGSMIFGGRSRTGIQASWPNACATVLFLCPEEAKSRRGCRKRDPSTSTKLAIGGRLFTGIPLLHASQKIFL